MPIRLLAFALLAGFSLAEAAQPKSDAPKQDPASSQHAPEAIDVDALARSKDVNGGTPADADAPPPQTSETPPPDEPPEASPPSDAAPPQAPPVESAPSEAPPPAAAQPADANVAAAPAMETAPAAAAPAADATVADTSPDATANSAASAETTEKISIAASCRARATSLLDDAEKGDFAGATSAFDAKMRTALPVPKFKEAWASLSQFGKLNARGQSHLSSAEGYTVVMIPLIFDKANLVAQVNCGTDGRVAGFYVKPIEKPVETPAH